MASMKFHYSYCFLLAGTLVLAGCSLGGSSFSAFNSNSSEDLLAAEGEWQLVEEKRTPSPVEKHMDTRSKVHPEQISGSRQYTQKAKDMHIDEDIHFRVLRLERQMEDVHNKLDGVEPRTASNSMHKPAMKDKAESKSVMAAKSKQKGLGSALRVESVRTGVHPGKYRMVLDMSNEPSFTYDLDNNAKMLTIDLPGAGWAAASSKMLGASVVKGYNASVSDSGAQLVIELKSAAKVTMAKAYEPNKTRGHRLVFDIAPQ